MGTKAEPGEFDCYAKAKDDEPMFILLARDPLAPRVVREWVRQREMQAGHVTDPKAVEALACADAMSDWRLEYERDKGEEAS